MNRDFQVEFLSYVKQKVVETEVKGRRHSSHGMTYAVRKSSPIRPLKTKPSCSSPVRTDTKLRRKQPSFTGGASLQLSSKSDSGESMPPVKKNVKRDPCIPAVPLLAERPKRTIIPKNLDESAGLSWREETDLKKALLASLRESKRQELEEQVELELKQSLIKPSSSGSSSIHKSKPSRQVSKESKEVESLTQKVDSPVSWGMKTPQHKTLSHNKGSKGISKAAMTTDYVSDSPSVKVRAQRKFAQGQGVCSAPSSPSPSVNMTPVKIQASASPASSGKKRHLVATKRAKTEDFLTFLCLRGTPALPKKLNFFNYPPVMTEKVTRPANMVKLSRNGGRGNTTPVKYEDGNSRDSFDLDVSPLEPCLKFTKGRKRLTSRREDFQDMQESSCRSDSVKENVSVLTDLQRKPPVSCGIDTNASLAPSRHMGYSTLCDEQPVIQGMNDVQEKTPEENAGDSESVLPSDLDSRCHVDGGVPISIAEMSGLPGITAIAKGQTGTDLAVCDTNGELLFNAKSVSKFFNPESSTTKELVSPSVIGQNINVPCTQVETSHSQHNLSSCVEEALEDNKVPCAWNIVKRKDIQNAQDLIPTNSIATCCEGYAIAETVMIKSSGNTDLSRYCQSLSSSAQDKLGMNVIPGSQKTDFIKNVRINFVPTTSLVDDNNERDRSPLLSARECDGEFQIIGQGSPQLSESCCIQPRDTPPRRPFSKHSDRFPRASSPPPNLSPVKPIAMRPTPTKSRVPPPLLPIEPLKKYESKKVMTRSESAVKLKKLQVTVTRLRSGKVAYSHHHKSPFKTYHKVQKLKKTKEAISEKIKAKKSKKTDGGEERGESQKMKKNKDSVDTNEKKKSAKQKVVKKKLNTDDSKPMKMLPLEEPSRKKTKTLVSHEKPLTQGKSRAKPIKDGAKSKGTTKDHPKRKIKTEVTTNMPIKQEKLKKETDDEMHSTTDKGMLTRRGRASSVPHSDEIEITFKTIMPKIPSKQCLSSHCSNSSRSSKVSLGKRKFEGSEHKDSIGVEQHISGTLPAKLSKKNTDIPQGSKLRSQSSGAVTEESCEKKRCHPGERARRVTSTMSSRAKNNLIKMPVSNKRGRPTAKSSPTSERMKETVKGNEEAVQLSEAPMYSPAANEFVDPIDFIEAIKPNAEQQGMCKIIPPQEVWKPECKVRDDMRFVYQIQHVHKMYKRWGPNVQHVECIKRQLEAQGGGMEHPPNVGGIELDLSRLQQAIQSFGGMQTVLAKNILPKVCDALNIPRMALDRMSRLYDAYCKYLVPYDTLTTEEKEKLDQQVSMMRQKKKRVEDDCVLKGKSTSLGNFYRVARNTKLMWFTKEEPSPEQVEHEYWKIVTERQVHVAVHAGHVGTQHWGSGFPNKRENQYYRHGWNFNNVPENANNLLKVLGTIESVTTPTLHIGMLFSTSCWSRDPHLLPYIVYNHTGADVIWYCIPGSETQKFQTAMKKLVPSLVTDQPVWLPEDTVMISPRLLLMEGVSVNRTVQSAGQFIAVFPESFTATLSCGYNVLESVHFAPSSWIPLGRKADGLLSESSESQLFPVEQLFCSLVRDDRTPVDTLKLVLPELTAVIEEENSARQQLLEAGLHSWEKMELPDDPFPGGKRKKSFETLEEEDNVCEICKKICYFSMVVNESEDAVYCLKHALPHVQKKKNLKACKVMFRCTEKELQSVIDNTRDRIEALSNTSTSSRKRQAKVKVC
ncbi:protein Jumonji isoform X1 [Lingula anatina]|uniref:Protein Jumonji isoform X1 n=1 Tax=Lingula anatina TaxID=7574 RepID=A0A1S3HUG7_LINAN|nr:protein Jumonji isoform X1 [Lingula anatina]|eukprot:XP_013389663.1 protein Jumonji isoform X1 [Lingula anatina]